MRKTKVVVIQADGGRDKGKTFLLTEMDADRAERWATQAFFAVSSNGVDVPPEVMQLGMGALVAVGVRAILTAKFEDAWPLLDDMMTCVTVIPDPTRPALTRPLDKDDIEEVTTRLLLRSEVFELHTGFSVAAFLSDLGKKAATRDSNPSTTSTSPVLSEPS
jgi:hypothetical protein